MSFSRKGKPMLRYTIIVLFIVVTFSLDAHASGPVTSHIPFEDFTFLDDDFIHKTGIQSIDDRELSIVNGRFGNAIRHGAVRGGEDTVSTSGNDLDLITAIVIDNYHRIFENIRFREPCLFGTGIIHPALGSVAFWVKCPPREGQLFEQTTSAWGRTEKQLIEVFLHADGSLSAYVEDARYVQHTIRTGTVWDNNEWNHVVFMWDRASGLELCVNGKKAASSFGSDAWWANQIPGLFHLPMPFADYDEFYAFDRPLSMIEIDGLYRNNHPPENSGKIHFDEAAAERLAVSFISDTSGLPVIEPWRGETTVLHSVTPLRVHDEGVNGWWVADGRYECAWPHEYTIFTVIPGDVDFHAEKAELLPPAGANVNYVTFEGNLDGVSLYTGPRNGSYDNEPVLPAQKTDSFFYGTCIDGLGDRELMLPFTKEYGVPSYFESDVLNLPLSGDLRIHEVGLFSVYSEQVAAESTGRRLFLSARPPKLDDLRYPRALESLFSVRDRNTAGIYESNQAGGGDIRLDPMTSLHVFSEPSFGKTVIDGVTIDAGIASPDDSSVLSLRVRNPAVPSQTWTHAVVRLNDFGNTPGRLRLKLSFDPVVLATGDRLWIEMVATEGMTVSESIDGRRPSVLFSYATDWTAAEDTFARRTLRPNILSWGRMFEFIPWDKGLPMPDVDAPSHFGGPYDTAYPWQAVIKVNPLDRVANIYKAFGTNEYERGRHPGDLDSVKPRLFDAPSNAPDWAVHFRAFQSFRERIIHWWRDHQRSDGQVGGGWNDDTLIFGWRYSYGDMPLDGNREALALYNKSFDGFEKTNYFRDGYCRVWPIDQLHNGDFVRNRCKSLMYNLGDPRSAVWAMGEAWHWGRPDETPVNYGDGSAFLFGKNVLEWYWNRRRVEEPYILDRNTILDQLRQAAFVHNDTTFWRYTEAWCHTDDQYPLGGTIMFDVLCGGLGEIYTRYSQNPRGDDTMAVFTPGVCWLDGGGSNLARLVEYSGNDSLTVALYSFDTLDRAVTARILRLDNGRYTVRLRGDFDGNGSYEKIIEQREQKITRFDRVSFAVPPKVPAVLEIAQIERIPAKSGLPDLAVSNRYIRRENGSVIVTVHNIGTVSSGEFGITLFDGNGDKITSRMLSSLKGAAEFIPSSVDAVFRGAGVEDALLIVVDPDGAVEEYFKENNSAALPVK